MDVAAFRGSFGDLSYRITLQMSIHGDEPPFPESFVELTPVGKQIEMLRIQRGLSKQHLARYAGTSRQQLWRVMTGKSELTSSLRHRLAEALHVDAADSGRAEGPADDAVGARTARGRRSGGHDG